MTKTVKNMLPAKVYEMQDKFAVACQTAQSMQLQNDASAAFQAVCVIKMLRDALTDEVLKEVFMPLMNTKIGFRTDLDPNKPQKQKDGSYKTPQPYSPAVVRDCLVDAVMNGLLPTGNQFNIIAGNMYPTKEGYSALLKKIGCKYVISYGQDNTAQNPSSAEIRCSIAFEYNGEKNGFSVVATVPKNSFSTYDQLKGKAERRAKKALYEYITGTDLGEADEDATAEPAEPVKEVDFEENAQQAQPKTQRQVLNEAAEKNEANWRQQMAQQPADSKPNF